MLEKMGEFFDSRLDIYDEHQLTAIEGAREFYPFTASLLPTHPRARVLDLGCGTGLELEWYFRRNPTARVTGIDLAHGMLRALREKLRERDIELICGSYFEVPLGRNRFDAAVSVESLHHFTQEQKIALYRRVRDALAPDGYLILTDYFARSDEEEAQLRGELARLRREQGASDDEPYHFDCPLTVPHETEALLAGGFASVEKLSSWGSTATLKARP